MPENQDRTTTATSSQETETNLIGMIGDIVEDIADTEVVKKAIETLSDWFGDMVDAYIQEATMAKEHQQAVLDFAIPHKSQQYEMEIALWNLLVNGSVGSITGTIGTGTASGDASRTVGGALTDIAKTFLLTAKITVIGDSLGVGTQSHFKTLAPNTNFDVKGSRQIVHSDKPYDATYILEQMIRNNQLQDYVVFIIGTNRGVEQEEVEKVISLVGASRKLLLVDTASEVGHANKVADEYLAASKRHDNVFYVNWSSYALSKMDTLYSVEGGTRATTPPITNSGSLDAGVINDSDSKTPGQLGYVPSSGGKYIHMTPEGYKKHAEYIGQAVYQASIYVKSSSSGGQYTGPASGLVNAILEYCKQFDGLGYTQNTSSSAGPTRYGPTHYDCSSLAQKIYKDIVGIDIGATTYYQVQYTAGQWLSPDTVQPGDLLFYGSTGDPYHVAICVEGGTKTNHRIFHAATPALGIMYQDITSGSGLIPYTVLRINELL